MSAYVVRRALLSIPTLFLVVTVVFLVFQIIPSDPARLFAGETAAQETVEQIRKDLGLDRPAWVQYTDYITKLFTGNLGRSFITRRLVVEELGPRFVNTIKLSVWAILLATVVGVLLGTIAAVNQGKTMDHVATIVALLGISIPVFWLGLLMMYFFSVTLGILPSAGNDTWRHYIMPTVALSVFSLAFIARMTRSSLLEVIRQDYVRTARAKGAQEWVVIGRHALANALLPVVIVVGLRFGFMLGGALVVEEVFAWPGLGRLMIVAVGQRDIPVVQGVLLLFAATFFLINTLVDLAYGLLDPRIRYA